MFFKTVIKTAALLACAADVLLSVSCVPDNGAKGRLRAPDETVFLYPEGQDAVTSSCPGSLGPLHSNGLKGAETYNGYGFIANVGDSARLELYYPNKPNGQMLLVCPGGGYSQLNAFACGTAAGNWLSERGYVVAVLKYRMPEGDIRLSERDIQNSMLYCRLRADEWGVQQIGILGGSAGGHLAALSLYHNETPATRPDFAVLLYPLTTLRLPEPEQGLMSRMFGPEPWDEAIQEYSVELHTAADFPPVFIAANRKDWILSCENYLWYYYALDACDVDVEIHLYGEGYHGWAFTAKEYSEALNTDNSGVWGIKDTLGTKYDDQMGPCRKAFETDLLTFLERIRQNDSDEEKHEN